MTSNRVNACIWATRELRWLSIKVCLSDHWADRLLIEIAGTDASQTDGYLFCLPARLNGLPVCTRRALASALPVPGDRPMKPWTAGVKGVPAGSGASSA